MLALPPGEDRRGARSGPVGAPRGARHRMSWCSAPSDRPPEPAAISATVNSVLPVQAGALGRSCETANPSSGPLLIGGTGFLLAKTVSELGFSVSERLTNGSRSDRLVSAGSRREALLLSGATGGIGRAIADRARTASGASAGAELAQGEELDSLAQSLAGRRRAAPHARRRPGRAPGRPRSWSTEAGDVDGWSPTRPCRRAGSSRTSARTRSSARSASTSSRRS